MWLNDTLKRLLLFLQTYGFDELPAAFEVGSDCRLVCSRRVEFRLDTDHGVALPDALQAGSPGNGRAQFLGDSRRYASGCKQTAPRAVDEIRQTAFGGRRHIRCETGPRGRRDREADESIAVAAQTRNRTEYDIQIVADEVDDRGRLSSGRGKRMQFLRSKQRSVAERSPKGSIRFAR